MWVIILWLLVFIGSIVLLVKASDYFTDAAEKVGLFFGLPPFIIGVTIVAIGTSLPELISSIMAMQVGSTEIVIGNVIGSNIANILLILGLSAIIAGKMVIHYELIHVDLPLLVGSAFFLVLIIWDGVITIPESILCFMGTFIYLIYTLKSEREHEDREIEVEMKEELVQKRELGWKTIALLIGGAIGIYFGAKYTIEAVVALSDILKIGKEIIAVSAVAVGTSLPELVVSITAARKKKPEIAVGNILGSNIFNIFLVIGISGMLGAILVPANMISIGLPVLIIATLLCIFMTQDREITRYEGGMLLLFYVLFVAKVFNFF